MQLGQGARREIIEDLLDLQVFSQMNRLLKTRIDGNRKSIEEIKYEIDLLDEKIVLQKQYLQSLKNKAQADRQDILNRISASQEEIESIRKEIIELELSIKTHQDEIADFEKIRKRKSQYDGVDGQLRERSAKLRKELKFFSDNDHCPTCKQNIHENFKCETIDLKNKKLSEVNSASTQLAEEVKNVQNRLKQIEHVQKSISKDQATISSHNSRIAGLNSYITELQKDVNSENSSSGFTEDEHESKLKQYREDHVLLESRRSDLLIQKSTYDVASVLLKDGGIKSKIIKQYIPIINAAINKYLQILDLNVQFEIDEEFQETLRSRFREDFTYESFSEGEKMRISLAITFAWRTIAKMRNSSSTNLLILDEVADGGVDSDGIDDLVKIINTMEDTHVFVISHRESMMDKFHSTIKFEKIKNFSHIVED
jgi:DNA repair exonuclease SbcCD ATPase subunit